MLFRIYLIFFISIFSYSFAQSKKIPYKYIFAKSDAGDRCHNALNSFLNKNALEDEKIFFCKSSKDAIQLAASQKEAVFLKLTSIPSYYIHDDVISALQEYQISNVYAFVKQKTTYCLLRHKKALENKTPLRAVASTPYTLSIHRSWIKKNNLLEIEVPSGSTEAGRLLSDEILNLDTGIIGSLHISTAYPNLKVVKKDFNSTKTFDIYALVKVSKRDKRQNISAVREEINQLLQKKVTLQQIIEAPNESIVFSKDLN